MRKFLLICGVLAGVLAVADHAARDYAEGRVADQIATGFELDGRPDVAIGGWPFVWHALSGDFPAITVRADSVSKENLTLTDVRFEVRDVRVALGALLDSDRRSVRVGSGGGEAALSARDLNAALERNGAPATVTFEGTSTVVALPDGSSVAGSVSVEGTDLLVEATGLDPFSLALPVPVRGIVYESVKVRESKAIFTFDFTRARLNLG